MTRIANVETFKVYPDFDECNQFENFYPIQVVQFLLLQMVLNENFS